MTAPASIPEPFNLAASTVSHRWTASLAQSRGGGEMPLAGPSCPASPEPELLSDQSISRSLSRQTASRHMINAKAIRNAALPRSAIESEPSDASRTRCTQ